MLNSTTALVLGFAFLTLWPSTTVAERTYNLQLASIGGVPQVKTDMEHKCMFSFRGKCRASTHIPVVRRRTARLVYSALITVPDERDISKMVEDCAETSAVVGAIAAIATGGSGALRAATAALQTCLTTKGINSVTVNSVKESHHGEWK